jgi:hypothetical protein
MASTIPHKPIICSITFEHLVDVTPPVKTPPTATPDGLFVVVVAITDLVRLAGGPEPLIPYIRPPKDKLGALIGTIVALQIPDSPPKAWLFLPVYLYGFIFAKP